MYTCHMTLADDNFPERKTRHKNKLLDKDIKENGRRNVTAGTRKFASAPVVWAQRLFIHVYK